MVPGPRLNIKAVFPGYGNSHVKDKTIVKSSYFLHGIPVLVGHLYIQVEMAPRALIQYKDDILPV